MTKRFRNWLFLAFFSTFLVLSTVILFFAFGYALSPYGLRLEKTGLLDIKTTPSGALVYLNDAAYHNSWNKLAKQPPQVTTPFKINNLTSGDYKIKLELAGYHTWEKKLAVNSGETTYLENVRFFKNVPASSLINFPEHLINSVISPDNKKIALLTTSSLTIFDIKKSIIINQFNLKTTNDQISWSPNSYLVSTNGWLIKSEVNAKAEQLSTTINYRFSSDNNLLYFIRRGQLLNLNLNNRQLSTVQELDSDNYQSKDWLIKNNVIYLLQQDSQKKDWRLAIITNKTNTNIDLSTTSDLKFINPDNQWLNIQDIQNNKLLLIDTSAPDNQYTVKTLERVASAQWLDSAQLLLTNESEIRVWDRYSDTDKLLTRLSSPLVTALWHSDKNYLIAVTAQEVLALELDDRNGHNQLILAKGEEINWPILINDGQKLLFTAKNNQQNSLYSLDLY